MPPRCPDAPPGYGVGVTIPDRTEPPPSRQQRASSFGAVADLYDQVRPTYPVEAVAWALEPLGPAPWRIADIGAGTGKMTRVLAELGAAVVAVEPDPLMRARLMATTPAVAAVPGSAESLPLGDGDLDAAVAAQAYHWFEPDRAHPELARVIRPGGVFTAIWNERDETVPWVTAYTTIIGGDRGPNDNEYEGSRQPDFGELFTPVEYRIFRHAQPHTADSLVALLQSRSYYLTASEPRQRQLAAEVRELARTHPDLAGQDEFTLEYETRVFRAVRR